METSNTPHLLYKALETVGMQANIRAVFVINDELASRLKPKDILAF